MIIAIITVVYLAVGLVFRPYSLEESPLIFRMILHALWLPIVIGLIALIKLSKQSIL